MSLLFKLVLEKLMLAKQLFPFTYITFRQEGINIKNPYTKNAFSMKYRNKS